MLIFDNPFPPLTRLSDLLLDSVNGIWVCDFQNYISCAHLTVFMVDLKHVTLACSIHGEHRWQCRYSVWQPSRVNLVYSCLDHIHHVLLHDCVSSASLFAVQDTTHVSVVV